MLFDRYRKPKRPDGSPKRSFADVLFRKLAKKAWPQPKLTPSSSMIRQMDKDHGSMSTMASPRPSTSLPNITTTAMVSSPHPLKATSKESPKPMATVSTPTLLLFDVPRAPNRNMNKRHSAEPYRSATWARLKQTPLPPNFGDQRHSFTFGHPFPPIDACEKRLTKADLVLSPRQRQKIDRFLAVAAAGGNLPPCLPQRSMSQQLVPPSKQILTRAHSTSNLNQGQITPLYSDELNDLLNRKENVMLIDVRNLIDYQRRRIRDSFNINLPSLLIKRHQRGTVSNLNLENFITTTEGRDRYRARQQAYLTESPVPTSTLAKPGEEKSILEKKAAEASQRKRSSRIWVVYDDAMQESQRTSQAWTILSVLQRAMTSDRVYYLSGGFHQFEAFKHHLTTDEDDVYPEDDLPPQPTSHRLQPLMYPFDGSVATQQTSVYPRRSMSYTIGSSNDKSMINRRTSLFSLDTQAARVNNANALARRANRRSQKADGTSLAVPQTSRSSQYTPSTVSLLGRVSEDEADVSPHTERDFDFTISEIIPGFLFVGPEIETKEQAAQLEDRKIKRVLNMAEECNNQILPDEILYRKISARDTVEMKNIDWVMMEAVCFIEEAKRQHAPIYVHCKAGKSRSVTAILAYLVCSERWTLKQAYRHVIKARPNMSPNIGFIAELMKMEGRVHGRVSSFMETDWQSASIPTPDYTREQQQLEQAWKQSPRPSAA
ncbi:uncharacterized protein BYT42DRAFT_584998 [Radiomyces spectabilis]|uniref:uncharacterized protein n=1 Tax=Radiomyces spectabilis TaxID=64574 RepID=UPI00221F5488|nr:uncharacterized protein BYT42DRAFT_584998 [Radiomyces spectabilis]KAI8369585.1 hypothetical protein BYT42DRAFT_584998 [Radiomyces spectabilis]